MKKIKGFVNEYYRGRIFKVPSSSEKGVFHEVFVKDDGSLQCSCMAGSFKSKSCKHRKIIQRYLDGKKHKSSE